jgi:hypothetical protein
MIFCFGFIAFSQQSFPESWEGNYKGQLMIYGVDSVKMKIDMELKIAKTSNDSVFDWTIIYNFKGKNDIRAYSLLIVDRQKGHYKIDEKNSILIDSYFHNNSVLTSFFEVAESNIIASYSKKDDDIIFEIISSKTEPVSRTGNTKYKDEDISEVLSFKVNGRQRGVLKRMIK